MTASRRIGPYELLEELGAGSTGRVYRARHEPTGAIRAVKVLLSSSDLDALVRFEREGRALARVEGEGVVPVHDAGEDHGIRWIAMALLEGGSLRDRLRARGKLPWSEARDLVAGAARALGRCHAEGVVHRDLKPANLLFDGEGRLHVADFGLARDLEASRPLTETGTVLGTFAYMAPEQLEGKPSDARADVYALGVILHELVAGEPPFPSRSHFQAIQERKGGRERLPVPAAERVLERALAWKPKDRFADGSALADALEAPPAPPAARGRIAMAAALLLAVGGLALFASSRSEPPAAAPPPRPTVTEKPAGPRRLPREEALAKIAARLERDDFDGAAAIASDNGVVLESSSVAHVLARSEELAKKAGQENGRGCVQDFLRAYAAFRLARTVDPATAPGEALSDAGKSALGIFLQACRKRSDEGSARVDFGVDVSRLCAAAADVGALEIEAVDAVMAELAKSMESDEQLEAFLALRARFL
ncbi:MAG TPA: serine/threonine-protein kinase, partial [Planctomycetota bacterium]|nr:serine/threonine-protein kinase [Planctomycetota bacterium]